MASFAERLKLLRKNKKMTQVQMAKFLGITERHYRLYEADGVDVPMSKVIKLSNFFNITLDYLLGLSDDDTPRGYNLEEQDDPVRINARHIGKIPEIRKQLKEMFTEEELFMVAEMFNVSLDYLVGRSDNPEINK